MKTPKLKLRSGRVSAAILAEKIVSASRRRSSSFAVAGISGTLGDHVYQAFKRDIITGAYHPGEALTEKLLATRYKSSRTPVREAAVRLHEDGLLEIVPNRGYFVPQITVRDLNEVYEFRAAVEAACAELATKKVPDPILTGQLARLARTRYRSEDRDDYLHFIEADTAFHIGLARLTRNHLFVRVVTQLRHQMERIMYAAATDIGYYGEFPIQEHCEILDAIRHRDPEQARKLMQAHILGSRDKVLQLARV